jgi:hypothetical protein
LAVRGELTKYKNFEELRAFIADTIPSKRAGTEVAPLLGERAYGPPYWGVSFLPNSLPNSPNGPLRKA